jgi:hypothetical protein
LSRRTLALIGIAALILVAVAGAGWWLMGVTLGVTTDPGGASVWIDGVQSGVTGGDGVAEIPRVRRGVRQVRVEREGFKPWTQAVDIAAGSRGESLNVTLVPLRADIVIRTSHADAELRLDGAVQQATRRADGAIVLAGVPTGEHTIALARAGHFEWTQKLDLTGDAEFAATLVPDLTGRWTVGLQGFFGTIRAFEMTFDHKPQSVSGTARAADGSTQSVDPVTLSARQIGFTAEGVTYRGQIGPDGMRMNGQTSSGHRWVAERLTAEMAAQHTATEVARWLSQARSLFENRRYQEALEACDQALALEPGNADVQSLRAQVQRTMSILGR